MFTEGKQGPVLVEILMAYYVDICLYGHAAVQQSSWKKKLFNFLSLLN